MKKAMKVLLSLALVFTTLFSYTPAIIYAQEDPVEETEENFEEELPQESEDSAIEEVSTEEVSTEEVPEVLQEEESVEALPVTEETQEEGAAGSFQVFIGGDGDVVIRDESLVNAASNGNLDIAIVFDDGIYTISNGYNASRKYVNRYFSVEEDEQGAYILISVDDLKANYVPSGTCYFSANDMNSQSIELSACEKATGLTAAEDGDDLVITGDAQFLQALLIGKYDNRWVPDASEYGSYLVVNSGSQSATIERIKDSGDGFDVYTSPFTYDEVEGTLRIPSNVLKGRGVLNSQTASIDFYAIGFETESVTIDDGISLGSLNEKVPFTISQNEAGDVVIESGNDSWLRSLIEVREYNNAGTNVYGSSISMNENGNYKMGFGNYYYNTPNFPSNTKTDLFYDEENGYVYIPFSIIKGYGLQVGEVLDSFYVNALGYGEFFYDLENDGISLTITKGIEDAPTDVRLDESEKGDLLIYSENEGWLSALCEVTDNMSSKVLLSREGFYSRNFSNGRYSSPLELNEGYVLVRHQDILNNEIANGEWNIEISANGYENVGPLSIDLSHVCKDAPIDVTVSSNEFGDLIVSSENTAWIEMMVDGVEEEGTTNRGRITVLETNGNFKAGLYSGMNGYDFTISEDHKSFTVPNDLVLDRGLCGGDYMLQLYNYGYLTIKLEDTVHFNDYVKHEDPFPEVNVWQDENTLDLWVTSKQSDWLKEMKDLSESEEWTNIDFGNGSIVMNRRYKYFTFVEENGEYKGFYISHEALLSNNVPSFVTAINFPETPSYQTFWVDLDFDLQACKKVPEGLKVLEDEEGIRFYFDETGEEELEFLQAMIQPGINDLSGAERTETMGSHINVYDDEYVHTLYAQNSRTIYSNRDPYENRYIFLSEDGKYVYIDRDYILDNSSLINSDQKYNISLHIYSYENYYGEDLYLNGLRYAKQPLQENFSVSAQLDEQMNLIIRSSDETWLADLCKETVEGVSGVETRGSRIFIINSESHQSIIFTNMTYKPNASEEHKMVYYELREDEQGAYIFISVDKLRERFGSNGEYGKAGVKHTFSFEPYGHEGYSSDPENEKECLVFPRDLLKQTPVLTFTENENGDVIISSENKDDAYLEYLNVLTTDRQSRIHFNFRNTGTAIEPWYSLSQGLIRIENGDLIITNAQILDAHVPNGTVRFYLSVTGYTYAEHYLDLVHACQDAPIDVEVETDSDKNLVIRSANRNWLNMLASEENGLSFSTDGYNTYIDGSKLTRSGNTAVLAKEDMSELPDGNYWIHFNVSGYDTLSRNIDLAGYAKAIEAEVSVECKSGDLIITCDDTDYLDALMIATENYADENGSDYTQGSMIGVEQDGWYDSFENYHSSSYGREYSNIEYTRSGNKIKAAKQLLINRGLYNGTASVELRAKGYPSIWVRNIELNNVCENFIPDDLKIQVEDNGDISIISEYTDWLKALCAEMTQTTVAGRVAFRRKGENGYYNSIMNFSRETYLTYDNGKVTIARDGIVDNRIVNGEYTLLLEPYRYRRVQDETLITITKGVQPSPSGIAARLSENGDIVIYSTVEGNEDFLKALARWEKLDKNDNVIQRGSYIFVEDPNGRMFEYMNYERPKVNVAIEQIIYDESKGYTYIPRSQIHDISGEGYALRINSHGYEQVRVEGLDLPLITVPSAEIKAGSIMQFVVNTQKKVNWSVSDNRLASVDQDGNLTALGSGRVYLSAQVEGNEFVDTIPVDILPAGNVTVSVTPVKADVSVGDSVQLNVTVKNGGDYYVVDYVSSDENIAVVNENGLVSFLNPGVVTITSTVFDKSVTSTFTVYEVGKGIKLVASIDGYDTKNGMEALDEVTLKVMAGTEELDPELLAFTSDKEEVAVIDENGKITALKSGSAKLTAALKDDPGKRSCTFTLKVYPRVLHSLELQAEDTDGILMDQVYEDGVLNLYFNSKNALKKTIQLKGIGTDKLGNSAEAESLTFAPVDASIVKVTKDGTASILKAGQTLIKASVSTNPKGSDPVTCDIYVRVIDYAPRLESAKVTLNKYVSDGVDVKIYAIASSSIKEISMLNSKTGEQDFIVTYEEGADHFNIKQSAAVKNEAKGKTYAQTLRVVLNDGSEYEYAYSIAVSVTLPKTTVKATGTYNTVLDDSTLGLDVTVKTGENYEVRFVDDWAKMDEEGNIVPLTKNEKGEYILKGKVEVSYEGYDDPRGVNTFNVAFKADKNLPKAELSSDIPEWFTKSFLTLNSKFASSAAINITSSNEGYPISNVLFKNDHSEKGVTASYADGKIRVSGQDAVEGSYAYTITPYITVKGQELALKDIKFTVKVNNVLPKVTISPATVKLNKNYHETIGVDVKVTDMPMAAAINDFIVSEPGLLKDLRYDGEKIYFELSDEGRSKAAATYPLTITPQYSNAEKGTPVNVKVSLIQSEAKASVSVKGSLNQFDPTGEENCLGTIKLSGIVSNVKEVSVTSDLIEARLNEEGKIVFTLKKADVLDQALSNVPLKLMMDTEDVVETSVNLKIARKAPVLKLETKTFNVYDTFVRDEEVGRVSVTGHDFGEIKEVWFSESLAYRFDYDKESDEIIIYLVDAANIKSANAKVTVKIDWVNDIGTYRESLSDKSIKGLKTSTLMLNIKDASNAVKAK